MSFLKGKILPVFKKTRSGLVLFFSSIFRKNGKKTYYSTNQVDLDRKLVHSLSRSKVPNPKQLKYLKKFLKPKELWLIRILALVIIVNVGILGFNFYKNSFKVVPVHGGEYVEGVMGSPQYINPLYNSVSDVDSDIGDLVYSSLFKFNNKKGLAKDLVEDYSVSDNKKIYTLKLREDVNWHHGEKLTAHDVVFTFDAIKNQEYDSPLRSRFSGVEAEQVGEYSLKFDLEAKKPHFLSLLTFGILPADLWSQATPQSVKLNELNLEPIGSGPYEFKTLIKNKQGNIVSYTLEANDDYYKQTPYIEEFTFKFFVSPEEGINALNNNEVNGLGYLPPDGEDDLIAKGSLNIHRPGLSQVNSLFFNKDINKALEEKEVREALSLGLNKEEIISEAIGSHGERVFSLLPSCFDSYNSQVNKYEFNTERAEELLEEAEWTKQEISAEEMEELETLKQRIEEQKEQGTSSEEGEDAEEEEEDLELSEEQMVKLELGEGEWRIKATSSRESEKIGFQDSLLVELTVPEDRKNIEVAEKIKEAWEELGVRTIIRKVPSHNIYPQVIKSRDFETLLYAQTFGTRPDLYPFWHSSEIEEGLNIAGYSNEEVDKLLEEARGSDWDSQERKEKYQEVQEKVVEDLPLIPLYSPNYTYVQSSQVKGVELDHIISPNHRFSQVEDWYIKTGKKLIW